MRNGGTLLQIAAIPNTGDLYDGVYRLHTGPQVNVGWSTEMEHVPVAHHGSDRVSQGSEDHDSSAGLVAERQVSAAFGRHRFRGVLVSARTA